MLEKNPDPCTSRQTLHPWAVSPSPHIFKLRIYACLFIVVGATHVEVRDSLQEVALSFRHADPGIGVGPTGLVLSVLTH